MKKQMLNTLIIAVTILLTVAGKTYGQFPEILYDECIVPVKLKIKPFAQIIPNRAIVLEQKSENNFEGQTNLMIYNNFPIRITAEIEGVGTEIADNYLCKLKDSNWGQTTFITTDINLFHQPGNFPLFARLENVNMAKVAYQDSLLDVARITITIAPIQY